MGFFARNAHKSPSQTSLRLPTISYRDKSEVRLHHYPHLIILLLKTRFRSDYTLLVLLLYSQPLFFLLAIGPPVFIGCLVLSVSPEFNSPLSLLLSILSRSNPRDSRRHFSHHAYVIIDLDFRLFLSTSVHTYVPLELNSLVVFSAELLSPLHSPDLWPR